MGVTEKEETLSMIRNACLFLPLTGAQTVRRVCVCVGLHLAPLNPVIENIPPAYSHWMESVDRSLP